MNTQPTQTVALLGSVSHGKSTLIKRLTGIITAKFKEEKERNCTIKLGYANCKIYKCKNNHYTTTNICELCEEKTELQKYISFVDLPGHHSFISTVLTSLSSIDMAIFVIAANQSCPQQQTLVHLSLIEIMNIKNVIILQNKIDLVTREKAIENYNQIRELIKGTNIENASIIPVSCGLNIGLDVVLEEIINNINNINKENNLQSINIIRSFDINRPDCEINNLKGGVIGGTINNGKFSIDEDVYILPGLFNKTTNKSVPLRTKIINIRTQKEDLKYATTGGLIALQTTIDPMLTRNNRLVGNLVVKELDLIDKDIYIKDEIRLQYKLFKYNFYDKDLPIKKLHNNELLQLQIGSAIVSGSCKLLNKNCIITLTRPVCCELNKNIIISRRNNKSWNIIGFGTILI